MTTARRARCGQKYDDNVAARVAAFVRGDDMRVAHHHAKMLALRSVLVGGTTPAAALVEAGREAAPGVLCYCGRSGYSAKCPMHGKTPNDDKGGTKNAD